MIQERFLVQRLKVIDHVSCAYFKGPTRCDDEWLSCNNAITID